MDDPHIRHWLEAEAHLHAHRMQQARTLFESLATQRNWVGPARLRLAQIASGAGNLREAVAQILVAAHCGEQEPSVLEAIAEALCQLGEIEAFLKLLRVPALTNSGDARIAFHLAQLLLAQSLPEHALPLLRRARRLGLDDAELDYLTGLALLYLGELDEAGDCFERCLHNAPLHAACHRQVSRLRRATTSANHVDRLRRALAELGPSHPDAPPLHYALFKELDELDDTSGAWNALAAGMRLRRSQVRHDAAAEAALFARMHEVTARASPQRDMSETPIPIFILGQPRSGTTLLERLLASSGMVADAGELRDFPFQLRWTSGQAGPARLDDELATYLASGTLDADLLGRRYRSHTAWHAGDKPCYTDKLPSNFMLAGVIADALPEARILHLRRSAPDVCFSNLKELFADAYPHSYDPIEMATHYRHYRALMEHWQTQVPGRILDVDYEKLVRTPDAVAHRVLAFCGLDAPTPATSGIATGRIATASSVQLRQPIDARYVDGWKRYARWLGPMLDALGEYVDEAAHTVN